MQDTKELAPISKLSRIVGQAYEKTSPEGLDWKQEKQFFLAQIEKNTLLKNAIEQGRQETIDSVKQCALEAAAMGISMNPLARLVYFIPRRARWRDRKGGETQAAYDRDVPWLAYAHPSYMGLVYIATHYGGVKELGAEVVYAKDQFDLRGPMERPFHRPTIKIDERSEKQAIGAYAIALMESGTFRTEFIDAGTIQRIRGLSDRADGLMWTTFWTEGWKKTVIRRLCKLVMQTLPQIVAAEGAMQRYDGYTFDDQGQIVADVPRGTEQPQIAQAALTMPKGATGLSETLKSKQAQAREAREPVEGEFVEGESPLANAIDCPHPICSIEWWCAQILDAGSVERLEAIRDAAIKAKVNNGDDAGVFRLQYQARFLELKREVAA